MITDSILHMITKEPIINVKEVILWMEINKNWYYVYVAKITKLFFEINLATCLLNAFFMSNKCS